MRNYVSVSSLNFVTASLKAVLVLFFRKCGSRKGVSIRDPFVPCRHAIYFHTTVKNSLEADLKARSIQINQFSVEWLLGRAVITLLAKLWFVVIKLLQCSVQFPTVLHSLMLEHQVKKKKKKGNQRALLKHPDNPFLVEL